MEVAALRRFFMLKYKMVVLLNSTFDIRTSPIVVHIASGLQLSLA